jgi:hypothetical protein
MIGRKRYWLAGFLMLLAAGWFYPIVYRLPLPPDCAFGGVSKADVQKLYWEAKALRRQIEKQYPDVVAERSFRRLPNWIEKYRLEFFSRATSRDDLYARIYASERALGSQYIGYIESPYIGKRTDFPIQALEFWRYQLNLGSSIDPQVHILPPALAAVAVATALRAPAVPIKDADPKALTVDYTIFWLPSAEDGWRSAPIAGKCPDLSALPREFKLKIWDYPTIDIH